MLTRLQRFGQFTNKYLWGANRKGIDLVQIFHICDIITLAIYLQCDLQCSILIYLLFHKCLIFFVEITCHYMGSIDLINQASVHCSKQFLGKILGIRWELNPGPLGEKWECYSLGYVTHPPPESRRNATSVFYKTRPEMRKFTPFTCKVFLRIRSRSSARPWGRTGGWWRSRRRCCRPPEPSLATASSWARSRWPLGSGTWASSWRPGFASRPSQAWPSRIRSC